MTDSGRELFKAFESEERLTHYTVDGVHQGLEFTAEAAAALLKDQATAIVGSAHSTVEEQYYLKSIATQTSATVHLVRHEGTGDGILLSEDRSPNLRGALLNGLIESLPSNNLSVLASQIDAGAVKTLIVFNEDLTTLGISEAQLAKVQVIYFGAFANKISQMAQVVVPTLSVFEKEGSFVNQNFRLQKFAAAVPGPRGLHPESLVLEHIAATLADEKPLAPNTVQIWQTISQGQGAFNGLTWQQITDEGQDLPAGALAELAFMESENLKFKPVALEEAQATLA